MHVSTTDLANMSYTDRRVGRPKQVTRELIARAACEIGLSHLTMRAVAERLGVSSASLYYHVRGREDLTRLVAEYSAARLVSPKDRGQHWARWLYEWAEYTRAAFVSQPGLLEQFLKGTLARERMLPNIDLVIGVMEREGFTADDAMYSFALMSDVAVGSAVGEMRREGAKAFSIGEPSRHESAHFQPLERVSSSFEHATSSFKDKLCTVLAGIAVRRGEDPDVVIARAVEEPIEGPTTEVFHP